MKKEFVLWIHYTDNSVSVSEHSTYESAVNALSGENPEEVMKWEINPNSKKEVSEKVINFKTLPKKDINGGVQFLARFHNNYGASIVQHTFSYGKEEGLWELAVIVYTDDKKWSITYNTPITSDVLGYLTEADVNSTLEQLAALPAYDNGHVVDSAGFTEEDK